MKPQTTSHEHARFVLIQNRKIITINSWKRFFQMMIILLFKSAPNNGWNICKEGELKWKRFPGHNKRKESIFPKRIFLCQKLWIAHTCSSSHYLINSAFFTHGLRAINYGLCRTDQGNSKKKQCKPYLYNSTLKSGAFCTDYLKCLQNYNYVLHCSNIKIDEINYMHDIMLSQSYSKIKLHF